MTLVGGLGRIEGGKMEHQLGLSWHESAAKAPRASPAKFGRALPCVCLIVQSGRSSLFQRGRKRRQFHLGIIGTLADYRNVKCFISSSSAFLLASLARDVIYATLLRFLQQNGKFVLDYMSVFHKLNAHFSLSPLQASTTR